MTNQSRKDSDLEALLARAGDVSAAWRAASAEQPSLALDDTVRAAARRAVSAGPSPIGASLAVRWRVPLSIAALLVVSASLTLLVAEQKQHVPGTAPQDAPRAVAPAPPELDVSRQKRDDASVRQAASPAALSDKPVSPEPAAGAANKAAPASDIPAAVGSVTASAPKVTAAKSETVQPMPKAAEPAPPQAGAARDDSGAGSYNPQTNTEFKQVSPSARELPAQPSVQGAASDAVAKRKFEQDSAAPLPQEADQAAPTAPPPARASAQAQPRARAELAKPLTEESLEPAAWIKRILDLRREGKLKEAADSFEAFRHRYPDYPLPQELSAPK